MCWAGGHECRGGAARFGWPAGLPAWRWALRGVPPAISARLLPRPFSGRLSACRSCLLCPLLPPKRPRPSFCIAPRTWSADGILRAASARRRDRGVRAGSALWGCGPLPAWRGALTWVLPFRRGEEGKAVRGANGRML